MRIPLITKSNGQYQWDVLPGSYRVHVEAPGYFPADSIVVSIPPAVTDLHVGLKNMGNTPVPEFPSTVPASNHDHRVPWSRAPHPENQRTLTFFYPALIHLRPDAITWIVMHLPFIRRAHAELRYGVNAGL